MVGLGYGMRLVNPTDMLDLLTIMPDLHRHRYRYVLAAYMHVWYPC